MISFCMAVSCIRPLSAAAQQTPGDISDDYFSSTQYSLYNPGSYMQYINDEFVETESAEGIDLDVPAGWDYYSDETVPKKPVIVAVIDTGIDYEHPDLAEKMWKNPNEIPDNGVDDDGNGYIDDIYGWDFYNEDNTICHYEYDEETGISHSLTDDCDDHGTHVAGIIAASKDNGIGIAGLASVGDIRIMSLKIHGGSNRKGKLNDAIRAIKYAESMGASVCNISWGTYTYSPTLASTIRHSKMLFVCAAGNDGTNNDEHPIYPASFGFDNIISVGFVNDRGILTYNSNYGPNSVDIVVPSTNIMSTIVGSYSTISGSSMAAPHISAMAALIYSCSAGSPSASEVRNCILGSIKELEDLDVLIRYPGIPSLATALQRSRDIVCDEDAPTLALHISYDPNGIKVLFRPDDGDGSGVCRINYMPGRRTLRDFRNGTSGLTVEDNMLYLAKSGIYTFYVEDYAGNAMIRTLPVIDDIVRPSISSAALSIDEESQELVVSAHVSDFHSGIRTIKYMRGRHTEDDFRSASAGEPLEADADGNVRFVVDRQGPYTIYCMDYRGNKSVITIMAYMRPSDTSAVKEAARRL